MNNISNFIELKKSNKIWAIGSIHSNLKSFISIKKYILENFEINDKLIFLGNVIGLGENSKETGGLPNIFILKFFIFFLGVILILEILRFLIKTLKKDGNN